MEDVRRAAVEGQQELALAQERHDLGQPRLLQSLETIGISQILASARSTLVRNQLLTTNEADAQAVNRAIHPQWCAAMNSTPSIEVRMSIRIGA